MDGPQELHQHLDPVAVVVEEQHPTPGHLLRLHHGLEVGQQAHVLAHVRGQHHVDHHLPHGRPLLAGQTCQDVALRQLEELEGDGQVVVLQHGLVVVHEGEVGAGGDEVLEGDGGLAGEDLHLVGGSRVVHIMEGGG